MKYIKIFEDYLDPNNEILCDIEDEYMVPEKSIMGDHITGHESKKSISVNELKNDYNTFRLYISFYKPNDTFHVIWVDKENKKLWDMYRSNLTKEDATRFILSTKLTGLDIYRNYKIITDKQYWNMMIEV